MAATNTEPRESYLRYALIFGALVLLAVLYGGGSTRPKPGAEAPDFELARIGSEGAAVKLSALRGTPVLAYVFASWCRVCEKTAPLFAEAATLKRQSRVEFIGVSVDDSREAAERARAKWGLSYTVLHDNGQVQRGYGINVLPTFILIDGAGSIRRMTTGALSASELESWLAEVGAGPA